LPNWPITTAAPPNSDTMPRSDRTSIPAFAVVANARIHRLLLAPVEEDVCPERDAQQRDVAGP
jgi:hypothetical protein